jgi:hypothetical protein
MVYPWGRKHGDIARIVAGLAVVPAGVIILDTFYNDTGSHALHFIKGQLRGAGPWRVGRAIFQEVEHGSPFAGIWNVWVRVLEMYPDRYSRSSADRVVDAYRRHRRL